MNGDKKREKRKLYICLETDENGVETWATVADVEGQKCICISYENAEGEIAGIEEPVPLEKVKLLNMALMEWVKNK